MKAAIAATGMALLLCTEAGAASGHRFRAGNPHWVAGGRLIVFEGRWGMGERRSYIANADGSARRLIPSIVTPAETVFVSPSGRLTADSGATRTTCIVVIQQLSGKPVRTFRIRNPEGVCGGAVWSPDDRTVLVSVARDLETIYSADLRSGLHRLSRTSFDDLQAAWSPDASRIALLSCAPIDAPTSRVCRIVVIDRDGRHRHSVARNLLGTSGYVLAAPVWSPDGRAIAFTAPFGPQAPSGAIPGPQRFGIYLVRPDGSELRRIALTRYQEFVPPVAWSPDSSQIAFTDKRGVWSVHVGGSKPRRLTTHSDEFGGTLDWAPSTSLLVDDAGVVYTVQPGQPARRLLP